MCWEDVLMGRKFKTNIFSTAASVDIRPNARRIGFWLTSSGTDRALLSVNIAGVSTTLFFVAGNIQTGNPNLWVGIEHLGDLMLGGFTLTSFAAIGVNFIEVYVDDDNGKLDMKGR